MRKLVIVNINKPAYYYNYKNSIEIILKMDQNASSLTYAYLD